MHHESENNDVHQPDWELHNASEAIRRYGKPPSDAERCQPGPIPDAVDDIAIAETSRLTNVILKRVQDHRLAPHIARKLARAVAENRLSQHTMHGILDCVQFANNRGAYFVASAKRAFREAGLSWYEEDWD